VIMPSQGRDAAWTRITGRARVNSFRADTHPGGMARQPILMVRSGPAGGNKGGLSGNQQRTGEAAGAAVWTTTNIAVAQRLI